MGTLALVTNVTHLPPVSEDTLDDVANRAIEAAARARRYHRIEIIIVSCTCAILIVAVLVGAFFGTRQSQINSNVNEERCIARAMATYAAASGDAFAMGGDVGAGIQTAADDLRQTIKRC